MPTKILIADDHEIFRRGIIQVITQVFKGVEVDEAGNGQEVIEKVRIHHYDAVLLDFSMPGRNGLDVLKQIKCHKPDIQVLILSVHSEDQFGIQAIKAGAAGYLMKESGCNKLEQALRMVLNGRKYISPSLANSLACYVETGNSKSFHDVLSDREYEVMKMTVAGKSVKQIASELSLSDKTVSTYRSRTLTKMKMGNTAQLIRYSVENRLHD